MTYIIDSVDGSYLEQYDDFNVGASFRGAAQASISYALQSRCGLQPEETFGHDDFIHVFDWNTPDAMLTLGTAISQSANTVLRQIGDIIKDYERSAEHDRTDLQADGRRPGAGPGSDRGGAETPGQIRHDADELSEGTQENSVQPPAADRQADK